MSYEDETLSPQAELLRCSRAGSFAPSYDALGPVITDVCGFSAFLALLLPNWNIGPGPPRQTPRLTVLPPTLRVPELERTGLGVTPPVGSWKTVSPYSSRHYASVNYQCVNSPAAGSGQRNPIFHVIFPRGSMQPATSTVLGIKLFNLFC